MLFFPDCLCLAVITLTYFHLMKCRVTLFRLETITVRFMHLEYLFFKVFIDDYNDISQESFSHLKFQGSSPPNASQCVKKNKIIYARVDGNHIFCNYAKFRRIFETKMVRFDFCGPRISLNNHCRTKLFLSNCF